MDGLEKRVVEIARRVRYHDYDIVNMQEMNEVDSVPMVQMLMDSLSDSGYEWTDEDAWDAMTDGQYGDYPGSGWDPEMFGY